MKASNPKSTLSTGKEKAVFLMYVLFLLIIVLNDRLLKFEFHNFITGKLSDFLGVICLTILVLSYLKTNRLFVLTSFFLAFLWWKSPFSSDFINYWNTTTDLNISRVVDYSDLLVFLVIPIIFLIKKPLLLPMKPVLKTGICLVTFVILTSSAGTHGSIKQYSFKESKYEVNKSMKRLYMHNPQYILPDSLAHYKKYYNNLKMDSDSLNYYLLLPNEDQTRNTIFWLRIAGNTANWNHKGAQLMFLGIRDGDYSKLKVSKDLSKEERLRFIKILETQIINKFHFTDK